MTILSNTEATRAFGALWAENCQGGEIFALHGVLGAGKTQLVKGLARAMGYRGEVTSPTFTVVNEYIGGRLPVYHLDLYRLENADGAVNIGIDDYLSSDGVTLIEWPERIGDLLPDETRHFHIEVVSLTERVIRPGRPKAPLNRA